ncbi:MAG TPA: CBS domain-containing protein [Jiangellaceae bacterium]
MAQQTVAELMTAPVTSVQATEPVKAAATAMRENDIGDVLVLEGDELRGVLTDRDLVVRVLAAGMDPNTTLAGEVCSSGIATVSAGSPVDAAIEKMRDRALRRLPVVDDQGRPVGVVSLGDLAVDRDPDSVLGHISAAAPNR